VVNRLLKAMELDKKVSAGEIKFVLAPKIGQTVWGQKVSPDLVRQVLLPQSAIRNRKSAIN